MEPTFRRLLVNTLVSGVTSSFLWFALTFWVYLETRSVVAHRRRSAARSASRRRSSGPGFGTFVDRHRKQPSMSWRRRWRWRCFAVAATVVPRRRRRRSAAAAQPVVLVLVGFTLLGSVAGQMRGIALSTCVTLLVPEERRDRANGMVGTVTGVSFAITSVFSGLVIGGLGMGWAYLPGASAHRRPLVHLAHDPRSTSPSPSAADG